jgi:hypothetical protein
MFNFKEIVQRVIFCWLYFHFQVSGKEHSKEDHAFWRYDSTCCTERRKTKRDGINIAILVLKRAERKHVSYIDV